MTSSRVRSFAAGIVLAATVVAPSLAQQLQPKGSEIRFVSRQMGVPVEGQFRRFDAELRFDPAKPADGRVRLTIDLGSASLGHAETERELAKTTWFDLAQFPQARFESSAIRAAGEGRYEIDGQLTIKGASQPVTVPVELSRTADGAVATGRFGIRRLDFRIGDGEWRDTTIVANEVQVQFRLALDGLPAL